MNHLLKNLFVLCRQTNSQLDHRLREINITGGQFMYIMMICENPGLSQERIAVELSIDRGAVARAVKQLELGGYIIRHTSQQDKRQYRIYPTPLAEQAYQDIAAVVGDYEADLTSELTEVEASLLNILLHKLLQGGEHDKELRRSC